MTQLLSPKAYAEFIIMLGRLGITQEKFREALRDRSLSGDILDALRDHPSFQLVHGQFNLTQTIRDLADQHVCGAGYDPTRFRWINDQRQAHTFDVDPGVAVVLVDHLDTLEETMRMLCTWISNSHECFTLEGIPFDRQHLARIQDLAHTEFQPRTRRWESIKLDAHLGKTPEWIRTNVELNRVAGIEVLCAVAQHPYLFLHNLRLKAWFNLCGLSSWIHSAAPTNVLSLKIDVPEDHVTLSTVNPTIERECWFNPVLV